jgi:hypothetical protein
MIRIDFAAFAIVTALATTGLAGCAANTAEPTEASDEAELRAQSLTGSLFTMNAIGGETTGFGLLTDSGDNVELDLATHGLMKRFVEGDHVSVTGTFKTVHGVEIPSRKVLVVTTLAAAPEKGVHTPGASIVTRDASLVVVENEGGGFTPPPPPGSQCAVGAAKFAVDLDKAEISWTQCLAKEPNAPLVPRSAVTSLSSSQLRTVKSALAGIKVAKKTDLCGADKPMLLATVTSPAGKFEYKDSFYSCINPSRPHVDGLDEALSQLRDLVNN